VRNNSALLGPAYHVAGPNTVCEGEQRGKNSFSVLPQLPRKFNSQKNALYCCVRDFVILRATLVLTDMRPPLTAIAINSARNHVFNDHELFEPLDTG